MDGLNVFGVESLSRFLPYRSFNPDTGLFENEESTGFVLRARPMVGAHLTDQENLAEFFRKREFLREGTSCQFLLWANPKCERIFSWWEAAREGEMYKNLARRRSDFLSGLTRSAPQGLPLIRDFQLFISFSMPGSIQTPQEEEHFLEIRDQLREKLRTMGIPTEVMNAQDFVQSFGELLSLKDEPTTPFRWNKYEDLNKQLVPADVSYHVESDQVDISTGFSFRSFVLKTAPPTWSLVLMDKFLGEGAREGLNFPFLLHYGLTVAPKQSQERMKGISKRESLERSLKSNLGKFIPELKDQYGESLEMVEELQRGESVCVASLSFGILERKENLDKATSKLIAHTNRLGFEFVPANYTHLPMMLSYLPMTWSNTDTNKGAGMGLYQMRRAKKTITREAQNLLPLLGEWTGQNTPGIPLVGRAGQLFFWSNFGAAFLPGGEKTNNNYNVCVAGQSGSGKSVLLQEMANSVLSVGGTVFIFDYGRSFEEYVKLLSGEHITFNLGNPKSLNCFSQIPEIATEEGIKDRAECLAAIACITKVMASPINPLGDLESSFIDEAVERVAREKGRAGDLTDIRDYLLNRPELTAKNVAQLLFPFTREGVYGGFYAGEAKQSYKGKLVCIEPDDLRNHLPLRSTVIQSSFLQIDQMMLKTDRKKPVLIIGDEAWTFLQGHYTAEFFAGRFRTTRKYRGAIVLATQLLSDYFQDSCPAATAAFNTSSWKIVMNQAPDAIEAWAHHPQMKEFAANEALIRHMKSIHTRTPHYAEMAIFNENLKAIPARLMLDPFSRILYSTNAEEVRLVKECQAKGLSILESVERVVEMQEAQRIAA